jgi:hypothetical protein
MAAFAITEAASIEIRSRLESSECDRPIASLMDSSQSFSASSEIVDAISRKAGDSDMLAIAMKEYRERETTLDFRLGVGIYEADDCRPEDLVKIEGLQFALPKEMREYLTDHVLDYVDSAFLMRNGHRVYLRLMDVGKGEASAV